MAARRQERRRPAAALPSEVHQHTHPRLRHAGVGYHARAGLSTLWRRGKITLGLLLSLLAAAAASAAAGLDIMAAGGGAASFQRVKTQFIAADPGMSNGAATAGVGAQDWGLWRLDPGPRGVRLSDFARLQAAGGTAPAGWSFDSGDWWLEEHGLIMEKPSFPLPASRYLLQVLNGPRQGSGAVLTVAEDGDGWSLGGGVTLHEVTHLPCRSGRYSGGLPSAANSSDFPVAHGAEMPTVPGCSKVDYAVLFVVGLEPGHADL
eukprot:COSAG01_NODE_12077_length_1804_cov_8.699947_1_plen_262_part_00